MVTPTGLWHRAHQLSLFGLSQSSASMRCARAKPKAGFGFNVQKEHMMKSCAGSLAKKPHLDLGLRGIRVAESQLEVHQPVPLSLGRGGAI